METCPYCKKTLDCNLNHPEPEFYLCHNCQKLFPNKDVVRKTEIKIELENMLNRLLSHMPEDVMEMEMNLDDLKLLNSPIGKQYYKAAKKIDQAVASFKVLQKMVKSFDTFVSDVKITTE